MDCRNLGEIEKETQHALRYAFIAKWPLSKYDWGFYSPKSSFPQGGSEPNSVNSQINPHDYLEIALVKFTARPLLMHLDRKQKSSLAISEMNKNDSKIRMTQFANTEQVHFVATYFANKFFLKFPY